MKHPSEVEQGHVVLKPWERAFAMIVVGCATAIVVAGTVALVRWIL